MSKILVHIGYPKTGTTTLQDVLFTHLDEYKLINYIGKHYRKDKKPNSNAIVHKIAFNQILPTLEEEINEIRKNNNKKLTILSNEDFAFSFLDNIDGFYIKYIHPYETAKRIKRLFEEIFKEIEILIVIRAQETMLYSFFVEIYKWKYRYIENLNTFEKFLSTGFRKGKNGNFLMFYYDEIYDYYVDIFGKENVHLLLYEDMVFDSSYYSRQLATILGINKSIVYSSIKVQKNKKRIGRSGNYKVDDIDLSLEIRNFAGRLLQYESMKKIKKIVYDKNIFFKYLYKNIILGKTKNIVIKHGAEIPKPTEREREKIRKEFKESNKLLMQKANISDLKMKNYRYI